MSSSNYIYGDRQTNRDRQTDRFTDINTDMIKTTEANKEAYGLQDEQIDKYEQ